MSFAPKEQDVIISAEDCDTLSTPRQNMNGFSKNVVSSIPNIEKYQQDVNATEDAKAVVATTEQLATSDTLTHPTNGYGQKNTFSTNYSKSPHQVSFAQSMSPASMKATSSRQPNEAIEIARLRSEAVLAEQRRAALDDEFQTLRRTNLVANEQIQRERSRRLHVESERDQLQHSFDELQGKVDALEKELDRVNQKKKVLTQRLEAFEASYEEREYILLQEAETQLSDMLKSCKQKAQYDREETIKHLSDKWERKYDELQQKYEQIQLLNEQLEQENKMLRTKRETMEQTIDDLSSDNAEYRQAIEELEEKNASQETKIEQDNECINSLNNELEQVKNEKIQQEQHIEQLQQEIKQSKQTNDDLRQHITVAEQQRNFLTENMNKAKIEHEQTLHDLKQKLHTTEQILAKTNDQIYEMHQTSLEEVSGSERKLMALQDENKQLTETNQANQHEIDSLQDKIRHLRHTIEDVRKDAASANARIELIQSNHQEEIDHLMTKLTQTQDALHQIKSNSSQSELVRLTLDTEKNDLYTRIVDLEKKVTNMSNLKKEMEKKYYQAVEQQQDQEVQIRHLQNLLQKSQTREYEYASKLDDAEIALVSLSPTKTTQKFNFNETEPIKSPALSALRSALKERSDELRAARDQITQLKQTNNQFLESTNQSIDDSKHKRLESKYNSLSNQVEYLMDQLADANDTWKTRTSRERALMKAMTSVERTRDMATRKEKQASQLQSKLEEQSDMLKQQVKALQTELRQVRKNKFGVSQPEFVGGDVSVSPMRRTNSTIERRTSFEDSHPRMRLSALSAPSPNNTALATRLREELASTRQRLLDKGFL